MWTGNLTINERLKDVNSVAAAQLTASRLDKPRLFFGFGS